MDRGVEIHIPFKQNKKKCWDSHNYLEDLNDACFMFFEEKECINWEIYFKIGNIFNIILLLLLFCASSVRAFMLYLTLITRIGEYRDWNEFRCLTSWEVIPSYGTCAIYLQEDYKKFIIIIVIKALSQLRWCRLHKILFLHSDLSGSKSSPFSLLGVSPFN